MSRDALRPNRRATVVRLTANGRRHFEAMARQHEATVAHLFGTLTATERKAMHTLLGSVKQHLGLERTA